MEKEDSQATLYFKRTRVRLLEEYSLTERIVKSMWKNLPRGFTTRIINYHEKGERVFTKSDGISKVTKSYVCMVKKLYVENPRMLTLMMKWANENRMEKNKGKTLAKEFNKEYEG